MIKTLGCTIVFVASTLVGYFLSYSKYQRVKELRSFIQVLNMLETEIKFSLGTLPEAFMKISGAVQEKTGLVLNIAAEKMLKNKINAMSSWKEALDEQRGIFSLNTEDFSILKSMGCSLGEADVDNQIKNIRLVAEGLKSQEIKAEEERAKNGKLLKSMGVLTGLTLIIILY